MIEYLQNYKYHIGGVVAIVFSLIILFYFKKNNLSDINHKTNIKENNNHNNDFNNDFNNELLIKLIESLKEEIRLNTQLIIESNKKQKPNKIIEFKNNNFTKDIIKKHILIDSIEALKQNPTTHTSSNYVVKFGDQNSSEVYKNVIGFRLIKATIPHIIHTVTENNKRIDFEYGENYGNQNHIDLIPGSYTYDTFITHVTHQLNGFFNGNPEPDINFDVVTGDNLKHYTITWTDYDEDSNPTTPDSPFQFRFLWKTSLDDHSSPSYLLLGDNPIDYTDNYSMTTSHVGTKTSYKFPNIPNQTKHAIDLVIPEIPNIACKTSPTGKNIIDRIPLNTPSGSITYYRSPEGELQTSNYFYPMKLSNLTIQLYENDSNSLYESGNGHNYFEFEITIVQNTEYFK